MAILLSTAYFPPVEYFAAMAEEMNLSDDGLISSAVVWIEGMETFQKQSWRTRCSIYAADGPQNLSYPVMHSGLRKLPISEVRVDYSVDWVTRHKRAIISAYRSSAYFEYYCDEIFSILDSRPETMFELNMRLTEFFVRKTSLSVNLRVTEEYCPERKADDGSMLKHPVYGKDLRNAIHPKRQNAILERLGLDRPYFQVFASKSGFVPNLSVMDLLFNEGPDSIIYLKKINAASL